MPTDPMHSVIYPDLSVVAAKEDIDLCSPLLREIINFASNAYQRCSDSTTDDLDVHIAPLLLYLHLIEMADAVDALIRQSICSPAEILLRSMFEAILSLEYILETDYELRALSWVAFYARHQVEISEQVDPATSTGSKFEEVLDQDNLVASEDFAALKPMADMKRDILQRLLNKEHFSPILEWLEHPSHRKIRNWYSLFDGPATLRDLARRMGRHAQYLVLYRGWSQVSHALDISRFLNRAGSQDPTVQLIRDPRGIKTVAGFAATFVLTGTRLVLGKFRPGEDYSAWYRREVMEDYHRIWDRDSQAMP